VNKAFAELAQTVPGKLGVAIVSAGSEVLSFGEWSDGVAWSTIKVPLAVAALRAGSASSDQLIAAITRSDNAAAEELWSGLGDAASRLVQSIIREAGDSVTEVESRRLRAEYTPFGQTRWSLADQARFAAGLPNVPGASRVIDLMRQLSPDHCWGLAANGFAAKGGWGPGIVGEDYLVRQFAILPTKFRSAGVALAADARDGLLETGIDLINRLADWLLEHLPELTQD
jgi:hypothetical protein